MLFNEIYSAYYSAVAKILREAAAEPITLQRLYEIVQDEAFEESNMRIPRAIASDWHLLEKVPTKTGEFQGLCKHAPTMPLSTLQKRWLKALLLDKRVALFDVDATGLDDVEPLFQPQDIVSFDAYSDGDAYDDKVYVRCFKACVKAMHDRRWMQVGFTGANGVFHNWYILPVRLEYSEKDDKFRLEGLAHGRYATINVGRMTKCSLLQPATQDEYGMAQDVIAQGRKKAMLVLAVHDERNALERVLLHFSHLAKECERTADDDYRLTLWYDVGEETEMVIRVLSFGPLIKVLQPGSFVQLIRERLDKQARVMAK